MFVPRPKVLSVRRDNPCGCPRTRNNSLTLPGQESFIKIKLPARFTARWHALGNPRRGFPTQKHSTGIFLLPSCAFIRDRDFALSAGRPKVSPLDSTAFKKAGEILYARRNCAKDLPFSARPKVFSFDKLSKDTSGSRESEKIKLSARIRRALTRFRCGRRYESRTFSNALPGRESSTEIKLPARGRCGRNRHPEEAF